MPNQTRYELKGLLLWNRHGDAALEVDGGGTCRLDLSVRVESMLGRRVALVGVRAGFDILDVQAIGLDRPPPSGPG